MASANSTVRRVVSQRYDPAETLLALLRMAGRNPESPPPLSEDDEEVVDVVEHRFPPGIGDELDPADDDDDSGLWNSTRCLGTLEMVPLGVCVRFKG